MGFDPKSAGFDTVGNLKERFPALAKGLDQPKPTENTTRAVPASLAAYDPLADFKERFPALAKGLDQPKPTENTTRAVPASLADFPARKKV